MKEIKSFTDYLKSVIAADDDFFETAKDFFEVKRISKGDYLIKEGQICDRIAYIQKGLFRTYYLKDGNEVNTCFCKENSITTSFNSFVNHSSSSVSIQALEDSITVILSRKNLEKLEREDNAWKLLRRMLTEKECIRLNERLDSLNFESALARYQNLIKSQPEIIERVPVQHIASFLGVSRETLSRIRAKV